MDVRVYKAAWRKHNLKVYMNPSCIGEGLHKYFRIPPNAFECLYQVMKTQGGHFLFPLNNKIKLRNML